MGKKTIAAAVILAILSLAAYGPALNNPMLYDDWFLLKGNPNFGWSRTPSLFSRDYFNFFPGQWVSYRPLSVLSYIINYSLWGEKYHLWRLVYLSGHVLNGLLLFFLFTTLTASPAPSLAMALLFSLHPVHSEVINQISFNEEIMVTTLVLVAVLFFLAWKRNSFRWAAPAVTASYAMALLTKETAFFLPLVFLAWLLAERPESPGRSLTDGKRQRSLFLALGTTAFIYLIIRFFIMSNPSDSREIVFSPISIVRVFRILQDYAVRLVWPFNLSAIYHFPPSGWYDPKLFAGFLLAASLAVAVAVGIKRRIPALAVPAVLFIVGLVPLVANLAYTDRTVAYDRYLYLPSIAFFWAGLMLLFRIHHAATLPPAIRRGLVFVFLASFFIFSLVVVRQRNEVWSDDLLLWQDAAGKCPSSPTAHFNLARRLGQEGRMKEAIGEYQAALETDPRYADAYLNLGSLYVKAGELSKAEKSYLGAVSIDPLFGEAYYNLGNLYIRTENLQLAEKAYLQAVSVEPDHLKAYSNLGTLYMNRGEFSRAEDIYRRILELEGNNSRAWNRLGKALMLQGRVAEAAVHFRRALDIDPGNQEAADNLGEAVQIQGKLP